MTKTADREPPAYTIQGKMKGGIRQAKGGTWNFQVYYGLQDAQRCSAPECRRRVWRGPDLLTECPKCGAPMREPRDEARSLTRGGFKTRKEALAARADLMSDHNKGKAPELLAPTTLAEYLRGVWLPTMMTGSRKQTTTRGLPALG